MMLAPILVFLALWLGGGLRRRGLLAFFFLMIRRPPRSTPLSLHDALPISTYGGTSSVCTVSMLMAIDRGSALKTSRSEEHTSELQSRRDLVCRLLLEK